MLNSSDSQPRRVIVDTNIVSYIFKNDSRALAYSALLEAGGILISFMTLAELEYWSELHGWSDKRRQRLAQQLKQYGVHYPDEQLVRLWGRIKTATHRKGRPIDTADAWVAATALFFDLPLVTHNPGDYAGVPGLTVLTR